jgi:hypothetical protein
LQRLFAFQVAEREQRRAADRVFVQQVVEQLRSSEGWQRWLATRRHFHSYSLRNRLTAPSSARIQRLVFVAGCRS